MKTKAQSQKPQTDKNKNTIIIKKSLTQGATKEEEFEENLLNIDLKKPRTSFNYYILEMREKLNLKGSITDMTRDFAEKYHNLSNTERRKYEKLAEDDKLRYDNHLGLVRKYLIDKPFRENASAYSIFVEEKLREARECSGDLKEAKELAREEWEKMTKEDKKDYEEKKLKHKEFYEELKRSNRPPNSYALFVQDHISKAKENSETLNFKEIGEIWSKASTQVKEKYAKYANEVAEDARKHRNLYELAYGIKPKLPISAYRFFYKDMLNQEKIKGVTGIKEARKLWTKLKDDEKEKYLKLAKKEQLSYIIKKREFASKNKKERTPTAINLFFSDLTGTDKEKYSESGFFNYGYQQWRKADPVTKKIYQDKALKLKAELQKNEDIKSGMDKTPPKRALSTINIYYKERIPQLKLKYPKKTGPEFFQMAAEEYKNLNQEERAELQKRADDGKEKYEEALSQYNEEMTQLNITVNAKEEERTQKRGRKKSGSTSRSKSKGKNDEEKVETAKSKKKKKEIEEDEDEEEEKRRSKSKKGRTAKTKKD